MALHRLQMQWLLVSDQLKNVRTLVHGDLLAAMEIDDKSGDVLDDALDGDGITLVVLENDADPRPGDVQTP